MVLPIVPSVLLAVACCVVKPEHQRIVSPFCLRCACLLLPLHQIKKVAAEVGAAESSIYYMLVTLDDIRAFPYYDLVQAIRTKQEWFGQAEWLGELSRHFRKSIVFSEGTCCRKGLVAAKNRARAECS